MLRRISTLVAASAIMLLVAACQTTSTTPSAPPTMPTEQVQAQITGDWSGYFTNRQGTAYPVSFTFKVDGTSLTGTGYIPDSSFDKRPTLTGVISGTNVTVYASSGFTYKLKLSADGKTLSGSVSGNNSGSLKLTR